MGNACFAQQQSLRYSLGATKRANGLMGEQDSRRTSAHVKAQLFMSMACINARQRLNEDLLWARGIEKYLQTSRKNMVIKKEALNRLGPWQKMDTFFRW